MVWTSSTGNGLKNLSQIPGRAATQTQRRERNVPSVETFVPGADPFSTSTPVLDMGQRETQPSGNSKVDTISAKNTSTPGQKSTVWSLSPLSFLEQHPEFSDEDLEEFDPVILRKLHQYSTGVGIPIGSAILEMLQFLMDGGMFDGERNTGESIAFYLMNYWPNFE